MDCAITVDGTIAGPPKGVMLSHHNIVSSMLAYTTLDKDYANDVYMAFLPLAHVLELIAGVVVSQSGQYHCSISLYFFLCEPNLSLEFN